MKIGLGLICYAKCLSYTLCNIRRYTVPYPSTLRCAHVLVEPLWLHYGESKEPGEMTHTGMACIERGLGAKPASSKSHAGAHNLTVQASDQQVSLQAHEYAFTFARC